jgi:hypothetical protein
MHGKDEQDLQVVGASQLALRTFLWTPDFTQNKGSKIDQFAKL